MINTKIYPHKGEPARRHYTLTTMVVMVRVRVKQGETKTSRDNPAEDTGITAEIECADCQWHSDQVGQTVQINNT